MEKTNISRSPLLKPVIEREYTKGLNINMPEEPASVADVKTEPGKTGPTSGEQTKPPEQKFNIPRGDAPKDTTKEFTFDDIPEGASDVSGGDHLEGINISSASAKTFANFAGDAIQMYLPKLTYGYCKVDIENVIVNVHKGKLTSNWIDAFDQINKNTEEGLKISDDAIRMWKKAFKDYLESENIAFANPRTAFLLATIVLLADQGVKAYQIRVANEDYMRQALEASNPEIFKKQEKKAEQPSNNEQNGAAGRKAA